MRIAQLNDCTVCLAFRADTVRAPGSRRGLLLLPSAHRTRGDFTEQERLAVEYAERFAIDHTSIDDAFIERLRGVVHRSEIFDLTICLLGLPRAGPHAARPRASPRRR